MRGFEQRNAGSPVGGVVLCRVEQSRQDQRAHHAQVLAERVLDPERLQIGQAQPRERVRRGEAVRDRLEQPAVAKQVLQTAAQRLALGQAPDRLLA